MILESRLGIWVRCTLALAVLLVAGWAIAWGWRDAALMTLGALGAGLFTGLMAGLLILGELAIARVRRRFHVRGRHPWPAWLALLAVLMVLAVIIPHVF